MPSNRRHFLRRVATATAAGLAPVLPPAIRRALAIAPRRRTGTIEDVEHVVILTQENRSFDHYFGTLDGVRGFGDRFPIPVPDSPGCRGKTVWYQSSGGAGDGPAVVAPFRLDTDRSFGLQRVGSTPHGLVDAQQAWANGVMSQWPRYKKAHAMGYFTARDIPFQFAMAQAFTICDAYHCSVMSSTNPNRLFLWTGSNDPLGRGGGPALDNRFDNVDHLRAGGYTWITYCERLQAAGISWQIYQDLADNFSDNPTAGFKSFREAYHGRPGAQAALAERGLSTRDLHQLRLDVTRRRLPKVSWIVAPAEESEHPARSSPALGADYTARVLEALTADPEVFQRTVLFVNFDENDGFFDHLPPPAPPSYLRYHPDPAHAVLAGDSTVSTAGEYHHRLPDDADPAMRELLHRPHGLGPRVPLYVVSPWSRGGWVSSEVADHTSIIRFIERRFGVSEPNISPWRRAVCGDLTSAFDFTADPGAGAHRGLPLTLPGTGALAGRARGLTETRVPITPALPRLPVQARGTRPSRALPYELHVTAAVPPGQLALTFANSGRAGACFHTYDQAHLDRPPRRYTVEPGKQLVGHWDLGADRGRYDLWVLGPNGFHRHFTGMATGAGPEIGVAYRPDRGEVAVHLHNQSARTLVFHVRSNAYLHEAATIQVPAGGDEQHPWVLDRSGHWYDFTVRAAGLTGWSRRFAGRMEIGRPSCSDPAMGGPAVSEQHREPDAALAWADPVLPA
jgi:phospholipase C